MAKKESGESTKSRMPEPGQTRIDYDGFNKAWMAVTDLGDGTLKITRVTDDGEKSSEIVKK